MWDGTQTPKADIFSLGVMLFHMLSLAFPYSQPAAYGSDFVAQWQAFWASKPTVHVA